MKQELKRIEAALHQLANQQSQGYVGSVPQRNTLNRVMSNAVRDRAGTTGSIRTKVSLPIHLASTETPIKERSIKESPAKESLVKESLAKEAPAKEASAKLSLPTFPASGAPNLTEPVSLPEQPEQQEVTVQSLSISLGQATIPDLPRLKSPTFTTHRNAANPALTMNLLKEMEVIVAGWQEELQQVLRQLQDLYLEGPIVDGWLESYTHQEGEAPAFRHADVDCLIDYVEKMRGSTRLEPDSVPSPDRTLLPEQGISAAGYRLCGLNEDGQLWFRHCPSEQVPSVSIAIARYQRLRILLSRKQYLETQLSQFAETLIVIRGKLNP
ncbi:MAG: hypothetical protein WCA35_12025 [Kovacikia sp.]